jgi:hypothetical protein
MPDAGASRKRQIQVTPGPFSGAAASSAYLTANRVQADSLSRLFSKVFPAFSTSRLFASLHRRLCNFQRFTRWRFDEAALTTSARIVCTESKCGGDSARSVRSCWRGVSIHLMRGSSTSRFERASSHHAKAF